MANLPVLRSPEQILSDLVTGFRTRVQYPVDLTPSSVLLQFFESVKQSNFRSYAAVISMVDAASIDRAVGDALRRLAADRNVPILPAIAASGNVDITDTTFQRIATTVYAGQPAPVAGSTILYVADATDWPAAGVLYLGRGTTNFEGPLQYTSKLSVAGGAYWQITLAGTSPTTKFHNIGESVVVGQGGIRTIPAGTLLQTSTGTAVSTIQFRTTSAAVIQDGEVTVERVPVVAAAPGTTGNVPRGAINKVLGIAFQATAFNQQPLTSGRDADTDDVLRNRIKAYEQAKSKGTATAIRLSAIDVFAQDELKRVVSSNVVDTATGASNLVFDDGTGYEPRVAGIGIEQVVDVALGGERDLQLRNRPIAQAQVRSSTDGPFPLDDAYALSVTVRGVTTVHTFSPSDFRVPSAATAQEVSASININPNLNFLATTALGGKRVVIYPRDPAANEIRVNRTGGLDASVVLSLSDAQEFSIRLYRNGQPLFEDGLLATVATRPKPTWSLGITNGDTLTYEVDGAPPVTTVFTLSAFQEVQSTASVSSLTDISIWAAVMSRIMPGVSARVNGEAIELTSNLGANDRASLRIVGGTIRDKMFDVGVEIAASGQSSDYTLNKQTGQLALVEPLAADDNVSAGVSDTRASVSSLQIPNGVATAGRVWLIADSNAAVVPNELQASSQVQFTRTSGSDVLLVEARNSDTLLPEGFGQVRPGDWLVIWANTTDPSALKDNQVVLRVETAQVGALTVSADVAPLSVVYPWFLAPIDRIVLVRGDGPVQRFEFPATSLSGLATLAAQQLTGVNVQIVGASLRLSTQTSADNGQLLVCAADVGGQALGYPIGQVIQNITSQRASVVTADSEAGAPNFSYGTAQAPVTDVSYTSPEYLNQYGSLDDLTNWLDRFVASTYQTLPESNRGRRFLNRTYNPTTDVLATLTPTYSRSGNSSVTPDFDAQHATIKAGDRFFLRSSYQFDSSDTVQVVVDGDALTKSYGVPVARRLQVSSNSTPTVQDFSASDLESSFSLNDPSSFQGFDFSDFKIWRRSRAVLTNGTYGVQVGPQDFGPSGDRIRVGFRYPSRITQTTLSLERAVSEAIDIGIVLPVTAARTPNWDASTCFTTSVTTTGGRDSVTYTYRVGTAPDFLAAGVVAGDVATIDPLLQILPANAGLSARVSSATGTTFTIDRPTGTAVADALSFTAADNTNGVVTLTSGIPHNIQAGQRFGLYGTAILTGATRPYDSGDYIATAVTPTTVVAAVPPAVPGGSISSAVHISNVVTVNATAHGLFVGNIVKISGAGSPYDGVYAVSAVPSANSFQYVLAGSSAPAAGGRFDFQTIGSTGTVISGTAISRAASTNIVTVTTAAPHGLSAGQLVQVASVNVNDWASGTYNFGDVVEDPLTPGQLYKAILSGSSVTNPSLDPSRWVPTTLNLQGIFPVATIVSPTQFTYLYSDSTGATVGTTSTVTLFGVLAGLARALGPNANLLGFGAIGTTAQQVVDFITAQNGDQLAASISSGLPTATIDRSTEDLDLSSNYLSNSAVGITATVGRREAVVELVGTTIVAGSTIRLSTGAAQYNGTYTVLRAEVVGPNTLATIASSVFASQSGLVPSSSGTYTGSRPYRMCSDGANHVLSTNLGAGPGVPQFVAKVAWASAPTIGEELRLISTTADQVSRFWNRLVVTGLSNVAEINNSQYGRQVQLTSRTVGSRSAIEVAGGIGNSRQVALLGSGGSLQDRVGRLGVPFDLRVGINGGQWLRIDNQVRNNKLIGFSPATSLQVFNSGVAILSSENFVQQRATTADHTTTFRVERHGGFTAIIRTGGAALALGTAGVKEGDWVRIRNVLPQLYDGAASYAVGNKVFDASGQRYVALLPSTGVPLSNTSTWAPYTDWSETTSYLTGGYAFRDSRLWRAVAPSVGVLPGSDPTIWEPREFAQTNNGIFRVVRVYGADAFWVENPNSSEENLLLGDPNDLSFYTYDSVMPGDTLVVSGTVLGFGNAGRYTVLDDAADGSARFPQAKRIFTQTIPTPVPSVLLGLNFSQVNIEEAAPISALKRVVGVGPQSDGDAVLLVDSPELIDRLSSSNLAVVTVLGKAGFPEGIQTGVDGYRYYQGLIGELNRVLYGDPLNPTVYPGVRAAGTAVGIRPAVVRRIRCALAVRTKTGVSFVDVVDRIKAAVAGYVNQLGVGEQVSLSAIVSAAGSVNGVVSVAVISPTYSAGSDLIQVGADEKPLVVDATTDITVSILGT